MLVYFSFEKNKKCGPWCPTGGAPWTVPWGMQKIKNIVKDVNFHGNLWSFKYSYVNSLLTTLST